MALPLAARIAFALAASLAAATCGAKSSDISPSGFLVSFREELDAKPADVYAAITHVARWWSSEHTYSGDAANMTLDPSAGGCWCERWNGNSVEHARVLYALQGTGLRLEGALGPLQALGVNAVLTFAIGPAAEKTVLTVTYRVRGAPDAQLDKLADPVDQVLGAQVKRLADLVRRARAPSS